MSIERLTASVAGAALFLACSSSPQPGGTAAGAAGSLADAAIPEAGDEEAGAGGLDGASAGAGGAAAGAAGAGGVAGSAHAGSGGAGGCEPTLSFDFSSQDLASFNVRHQPGGSVTLGQDSGQGSDGTEATLVFPGDPSLGPEDRLSPQFATELSTKQKLGFGTYRMRVQLATCKADEELVNGIFVYDHEGTDLNGNGLEDNNELDIEILCAEPWFMWLTSWTDYADDTHLRKFSRGINFKTGEYYETPPGQEGTYNLQLAGTNPAFQIDGFPAPGAWLELRWHWSSTSLRYFMVLDGQEISLWEFTNAALIPQHPAHMMFNLWHTSAHWWKGGDADYPASDGTLRVDWFKYWSEGSCAP